MIIKLDQRENGLITIIKEKCQLIEETIKNKTISTSEQEITITFPLESTKETTIAHKHNIKEEKLDVGDIILLDKELDESGNEVEVERIIFERKSLYDLAASIKDGRYNEQSYRLSGLDIPNHNIIYLIEGDLMKYNEMKGKLSKKTLNSAMCTLQYYKGFSVLRTMNVYETANIIIDYADKIEREGKKEAYYKTKEVNEEQEKKSYSEVCNIKKQKSANINNENIGEIMLSNIPGVSVKMAISIMKTFKSIKNLIKSLEENGECLREIQTETTNGQKRKLPKTCIENINKFLLI